MKLARISKFSFSTLLIGEHNGKSLNKSFLKIFSAVNQLKEPVDLLLAGPNLSEVCSSINSQIPSNFIQKIILIEQQNLTSLQSDSFSKII
jgi:electron transfer flavoprotein alpha subunit